MTIILRETLLTDLWAGRLDLTGPYRLLLLSDTYAPSTAHTRRSDLTGEIAATGGYITGGAVVTLGGATDSDQHQHLLTMASVSIGTGPITARYGACVRWRGGLATNDDLIFVKDFGISITSDGAFVVPALTIKTFY